MKRVEMLKNLQVDTDKALALAKEKRHEERLDDAINWADLRCTTAEFFHDCDDDTGLRVYVSEASPDAYRLSRFVQGELERMGWDVVFVMTEW